MTKSHYNHLIFLDIDGVLNNHTIHELFKCCTIDRDRADLLNKILYKTDAYFVLTSAWRYLVLGGSMTERGLGFLLLTHWVDGHRLLSTTRIDNGIVSDRGIQITEWLEEHQQTNQQPVKYCAIDNDDLGITEAGHKLFQCDDGLDEELASEIIDWFNNESLDSVNS